MTRIICVSDLHGHLPEIPECDLLLVGGDITPSWNHSLVYQEQWLNHEFRKWLEGVPAKHIVGIAGNHDFLMEQRPLVFNQLNLPWFYLLDDYVNINGYKIFGSPHQPIFYNWAFNLSEDELAKKWERIPVDTDILITHGPPFGIGDRVTSGEHVGSTTLRERLPHLTQLKLHIFGHIHCGYGEYKLGDTKLINCSVVNEQYKLANKPVEITL